MTIVRIPGSKSVMARALFLAAAADGTTRLRQPLRSDDTEGFALGLQSLGYTTTLDDDVWTIHGNPAGPPATSADVYCRDAGTAARFLPALAAAGHGHFRFDASAQMRRRPVGPLTEALRSLGVSLTHDGAEGHLPVTIDAHGIKGGELRLDAGLSSQFLTALLLTGPLTAEGLRIHVTDMVSVPYVEMTLAMMARFGVPVTRDGTVFTVPAGSYRPLDYVVEPDASSASYFFAAAAVTGRGVTVPGLSATSLQGDVRFVDVLEQMGATVEMGGDAITVTGPPRLRGVTVNMRDISDTVPTLAAIAPFADSPVRIEDVYNIRVKESDRLEACAQNLRALGIRVDTGRDWLEIHPGVPVGAEIACHGDHRIAMSFSVTGLHTPGITLDDPDCVKKTFPTFHEVFGDLRTGWGL